MERKRVIRRQQMHGEIIERIYVEGLRPATKERWDAMNEEERSRHCLYAPFQPGTTTIEDGTILCERDVAVKMRDGITLYCDIYRPAGGREKIPAILAWSCYGKRPNEYNGDEFEVKGVPPMAVSRYAKEEAPDPCYWCHYGYAVVNVDPRGVGYSEGDAEFFNTQEGQDGYDMIEWVAEQPWCSGKVGMAGNSCLSMTQWRIAAQRPPHLACIAPWEGMTDMYRESIREGGVLAIKFARAAVGNTCSLGYIDDMAEMASKYPLLNGYWKDKIPDFSKVECPAYVTACWNHFHLRGSIMAFRKISSQKKWLRAHREFEWPDFYCNKYLTDLHKFFDRYLKSIRNGWEFTPPVRVEVMDVFDYDYQTDRPEKEFPLKRTRYDRLYLNAKFQSMQDVPTTAESSQRYNSETQEAYFTYTFPEDTELTGYMKLHLWVEADSSDDIDLFVAVKKLNTMEQWLPITIMGYEHPGAWGKMRVSQRKLDKTESTDFQPVQIHNESQLLVPGQIVPVDIEINPHSRIWHRGEKLQVQIAGHYIRGDWFEPLAWDTVNHGDHIIHTGGQYDSYLQIPVIPPRYADGDNIYR